MRKDVILGTTTSTQDSGLLDVLVPMFEKQSGFVVKTVAVGSGQAMAMARRGEVDVLLVHSPADEQALVDEGVAQDRRAVMHNDFVLLGPGSDPAGVKGKTSVVEAFKAVAAAGALFVSRGDDSGTHKRELKIWKAAQLYTAGNEWYVESGSGMGATLSVSSEKMGYTLADRGTFLALEESLDLEILYEGDNDLLNEYHVMVVSPAKFPGVNAEAAKALADFMVCSEVQAVIGKFGAQKTGQPLFVPDA